MLVNADKAAELAGVSRWTIMRLIHAGRLKAVSFGTGSRKNYRIDPAELAKVSEAEEGPKAGKALPVRPSRPRRTQTSGGFPFPIVK